MDQGHVDPYAGRSRLPRDEDRETRRTPGSHPNAAKTNGAIVFLNDSPADPEAQPRTFSIFRGEKWLENPPGMLCFNTRARVAYRNPYSASSGC
jgi:hypothetical protein